MHRLFATLLLVTVAGAAWGPSHGRQKEPRGVPQSVLAGTWEGTFRGDESGSIGVRFEEDQPGKMSGQITISVDGSSFTAPFKEVVVRGDGFSASFDAPEEMHGVFILSGNFDDHAAKGVWSLREDRSGKQIAAGEWQATKVTTRSGRTRSRF